MITDQSFVAQVRDSWKTVRTIYSMIQTNTSSGTIFSLIPHATGFSKVPESLLLLFGVSVLEGVLQKLRDDGVFSCTGSEFGRLLNASKSSLPWKNYEEIKKIQLRRNSVAHRREFLAIGQCDKDLSAIAQELITWRILDADYQIPFTVSITPNA